MNCENERIEYKREYVDDIAKEVIAFANTDGGEIYVGVNDDGIPAPLADTDDTYTRITNCIRDSVAPDVTMFTKYSLNHGVIKVNVSEGSSKPYYLKSKGLKPSGVYIRQGASSVQASPEQIRQMIKLSDRDSFEELRSLDQTLTFKSAAAAFEKHNIPFSEEKYKSLGIVNINDDLFTNLGLIVSDQCSHTIKVAVFADEDNTSFIDHREFGGSVFSQIESAFEYIMLNNKTKSVFSGIDRIDKTDYPEEAIREALLNAVVHRDYGFSGSIIVNINSKCIDIISIGGLVPGLAEEDIMNGISQPRNRNLAEMFHRLKYIESYGTGIRKILSLYSDSSVKPTIIVTPNSFRISLPNRNSGTVVKAAVPKQYQAVIDYLNEHDSMTVEELQELLNIKRTRAYNLYKKMEAEGYIKVSGRGTGKIIILK
ncbi:MAG: RNA-binding domain-containing protein [Oscillospiraceae bacterium]